MYLFLWSTFTFTSVLWLLSYCLNFLQNSPPLSLQVILLQTSLRMWVQQEAEPPQIGQQVIECSQLIVLVLISGICHRPQAWPGRSPELMHLDYFLCGHTKVILGSQIRWPNNPYIESWSLVAAYMEIKLSEMLQIFFSEARSSRYGKTEFILKRNQCAYLKIYVPWCIRNWIFCVVT